MRKPSLPRGPGFWAALFYLLSSLVQFADHHIPPPEPVPVVHPAPLPGEAERSSLRQAEGAPSVAQGSPPEAVDPRARAGVTGPGKD
jgi:hypothetical protein